MIDAIAIPLSRPMICRADYYGYHFGIAAFGRLILIWPINDKKDRT